MCLLNFRELKEDLGTLQGKEVEVTHRKGDLEKQLEVSIHRIYRLRVMRKLAKCLKGLVQYLNKYVLM